MIFAILDHLWQSTLVVAVVALMAVVYRRSSAGIRYRLWLAASVKFLVPFAALNSFGKWLAPASPPAFDMTPGILLIQQAAQPVLEFPSSMEQAVTAFDPTLILETVWAVGFLAVATAWLVRWLRVRAIVRSARQLGWTGPVPIMSSATLIEPVLVGIRRAVLLVPERLPDHLTQPQIEAILAHEFCHLRRRDNLTATIHMLVEALFWFYPLIWWIGARMIAERERACDEAVVGAGHDPEAYARGILETCRLYLQSPLACAAGASGSNLKKRLEMIMTAYPSRPLGLTARSFLVGVGVCALASPVAAGLLGAPSGPIRAPQSIATSAAAESAAAPGPSTADVERLREEQQKPRQIVPFDPPKFDRYVGYYELASNFVFKVTRDGDKFFAQLTGQGAVEWYPESDSKFFATVVAAQISFVTDAQGNATELVLHQNGLEQHAKRIEEATATNIESMIARRIEGKTPSPGTEAFVRKWLASVEAGHPSYDEMTPELAQAARTQWPRTSEIIKTFGALKDVRFIRVDPQGIDIYEVDFENGKGEVSIAPLTADGKVGGLFLRNFDTPATDPATARRIANNTPSPGTEASIRRWLASVEAGQPNYDEMVPELAEAARAQWPKISERIKPFGALKTIKFLRVNPQGFDVYEADFENNKIEVTIAPLTADGKVATRFWTLLP